ncbi:MAG: hypothetical protein ACJA1B_002357, partial [Polaribacter sp.]
LTAIRIPSKKNKSNYKKLTNWQLTKKAFLPNSTL